MINNGRCIYCGRTFGEDSGDCFTPGLGECVQWQLQERSTTLDAIEELLKRLQAEENVYQLNMKRFQAGDDNSEPHAGEHHASLHRARFIRELFYALRGHMP